ncbi:UNVERIFIED_CONTAM: hypothetical protein NCL1_40688 [Trichonephila clavipes]
MYRNPPAGQSLLDMGSSSASPHRGRGRTPPLQHPEQHPDAPHESAGVLRPLRAALLRDGMVQALSDTCRVSYPGAICNELRKVSGGCFHPD